MCKSQWDAIACAARKSIKLEHRKQQIPMGRATGENKHDAEHPHGTTLTRSKRGQNEARTRSRDLGQAENSCAALKTGTLQKHCLQSACKVRSNPNVRTTRSLLTQNLAAWNSSSTVAIYIYIYIYVNPHQDASRADFLNQYPAWHTKLDANAPTFTGECTCLATRVTKQTSGSKGVRL